MIWLAIFFGLVTVSGGVSVVVCQWQIVERLRQLNGGFHSPLVSRDGNFINVYNFRFAKYLYNFRDETDLKLRRLKKVHLVSLLVILVCFVGFAMVAAAVNAASGY